MSSQNLRFLTPYPLLVVFLVLGKIGNFWPPPSPLETTQFMDGPLLLVPHDCKKNHHRPKFCHCVFLQCTKTRAVRLFHVLMRNGSKKTSFLFLLWSFPIVMAAARARTGLGYAMLTMLVRACLFEPNVYTPEPCFLPRTTDTQREGFFF